MDKLEEELTQASRFGAEIKAPANESNTCEWVILPLMWALGYHRHEIASRSYDAAGKLPDYTILPGTELTWYLEAKAWNETLSSIHVDQSLNYAHSNGRRWVVLSNGQEWQLYDDSIPGVSANRLVAKAKITEPEGLRVFLEAISKESISSGMIATYAMSQRLHRAISAQLVKPDSDLVRSMVTTLRSKLGLATASSADVVSYFAQREAAAPRVEPPTVGKATADEAPLVVREQAAIPKSTPLDSAAAMYLLTPVKSESGLTAENIIRGLLDKGWYVFADRTAGRKKLKPGDKICFYEGKKGAVAEATVASVPELGQAPGVKHSEKYRWRFRVRDIRYFFDQPIPIDGALRRRLDGFKGKNPDSSNWSWFVQGTGPVTEHDFGLLTGQG